MSERTLSKTTGLCPDCLEEVTGEYEEKDGSVHLTRSCPEHGETTRKVWAMASPIIQGDTVYGAVGIAGPKHRMDGERFTESMPANVLEAADTIELELEYQ